MKEANRIERRRFLARGVIQGVGFRPFVYRLATGYELAGWVRNTSVGVEIEVEGAPAHLERFGYALKEQAPPLAQLHHLANEAARPKGEAGFQILPSAATRDSGALIPADAALCAACRAEIMDPAERRHGYALTNCTDCGPRFTIIKKLPYDRPNTTMRAFTMCSACRAEYENPHDRRFHAQPIACPQCGPRMWLEIEGRRITRETLPRAGALLAEGAILAVKGLGGFHLACDARNTKAVRELRRRKGRGDKALAVMVRDLVTAHRLARLDQRQVTLLLSATAPIVLAEKRPGNGLANDIAPGNNCLGLMLPYTPLHHLLFQHAPPALVMTSGNRSREPLVYTNALARQKLARLADGLLLHDRDIRIACDDSVLRPLPGGGVIILRRARGLVPQPLHLPIESPEVILGVGGLEKNTFCLLSGRSAHLSQHIGDLDSVETYDFYHSAIGHFRHLLGCSPVVAAHDLHPDYLSTRHALEAEGLVPVAVQHHHAHIAACLAENGRKGPCIGLALDGSGYGSDGTLWGGEMLVADLADFKRVGNLAPVRLPGGVAAVRDPRRMAAAYLWAAYGGCWPAKAAALGLAFTPMERQILDRQLASGWQAPLTSSAGRLFDAVAAALGICHKRTYAGQPALELEMGAAEGETDHYPVPFHEQEGRLVLETPDLFRRLVEAFLAGAPADRLAARFHTALAEALTAACQWLHQRHGLRLVALSGGVFQNARLLEQLCDRLTRAGFEVLVHTRVPPNDGGLALGQAVVAAARRRQVC